MADPLGGPVGAPLIGPAGTYMGPPEPAGREAMRDMMAKMATVMGKAPKAPSLPEAHPPGPDGADWEGAPDLAALAGRIIVHPALVQQNSLVIPKEGSFKTEIQTHSGLRTTSPRAPESADTIQSLGRERSPAPKIIYSLRSETRKSGLGDARFATRGFMWILCNKTLNCCIMQFEKLDAPGQRITVSLGNARSDGPGGRVKLHFVKLDEPTEIGGWTLGSSFDPTDFRPWRILGCIFVVSVPDCDNFTITQLVTSKVDYEYASKPRVTIGTPPFPKFRIDHGLKGARPAGGVFKDTPSPPPDMLERDMTEKGATKATWTWDFFTFVCCDGKLIGWYEWGQVVSIEYDESGKAKRGSGSVTGFSPNFHAGDGKTSPKLRGALEDVGLELDMVC